VLKTSVRALHSVGLSPAGNKGFNGNRNQQNSFSTMEPGKVEIGAEIRRRNKFADPQSAHIATVVLPHRHDFASVSATLNLAYTSHAILWVREQR
jgi:hypothetical protein